MNMLVKYIGVIIGLAFGSVHKLAKKNETNTISYGPSKLAHFLEKIIILTFPITL